MKAPEFISHENIKNKKSEARLVSSAPSNFPESNS